jgi:CTP:molybdopterin cytidylyltransferase MocA
VPVDADGMPQWLCSAWPTALLRDVDWATAGSLRAGLGALAFEALTVETDAGAAWLDCDTPDDLRRAREQA